MPREPFQFEDFHRSKGHRAFVTPQDREEILEKYRIALGEDPSLNKAAFCRRMAAEYPVSAATVRGMF